MPIDLTDEKVKGEVLEALKKENYVVRTADEDQSFLTSKIDLTKKEIESKYSPVFSKIKELTGYEGDENEPDKLVVNAFDTFKNNVSSKVSEWEKKYSDLEKTVAEKEPAFNTLKQQFDQFKQSTEQEKQNLLKQVEDAKRQGERSLIDNEIGLAQLKFMPKVTDNQHTIELANARIDAFKRMSTFEMVDGKRVVKDAEGKIYQSNQDGSLLTVEQIVDNMLSDLYDEKRKQTGAGSGKDGEDPENVDLPEGVKSQMKLVEYYQKQGKLSEDEIAKKVVEMTKKYKLPIR